jgi:hypothetical protein
MYKLLQFALLKCFIAKVIYHWHFQISNIPSHQNFGSHPIDIGFLKKKNLDCGSFCACDSTIIHWRFWHLEIFYQKKLTLHVKNSKNLEGN